MRPYPLTFKPILKEKVWGGRHLAALGKSLPDTSRIGESWELAQVGEDTENQSVILNGPLAGMTLAAAISQHRDTIMGYVEGNRFPLLIKYLDAAENLSVQVHPSPRYVASHPEVSTKHEAWLILRADPDAKLYLGFDKRVTKEQLLEAIERGTVVSLLNAIPARPGRCFSIASGTVHALGAGITLAEIQTTSDTTFRIYDWGREHTPNRREMHIEQAVQCIDFDAAPLTQSASQHAIMVENLQTTPLVQMPQFEVERLDALDAVMVEVVTSGMPEVWMTLSGQWRIRQQDQPILEVSTGRTVLMPAALTDAVAELALGTSIARVSLPSPLQGKIA